MTEKEKDFLVMYEMPNIAEFIPWHWLQKIVASHVAWKVNRKIKRFEKRKNMKEFLKKHL